jgi:16S rRNA (guanine966-N2)-methyltransferase
MEYCPVLKKNLQNLKTIENYKIIEKDINNGKIFETLDKKFDIVFMDPPYKDKNLNLLLKNLENIKILNKNGIVVIHRHKNEQDMIPKNFKVIEEKRYGLSKIIFLSLLK